VFGVEMLEPTPENGIEHRVIVDMG
jgi:hypothetical protein